MQHHIAEHPSPVKKIIIALYLSFSLAYEILKSLVSLLGACKQLERLDVRLYRGYYNFRVAPPDEEFWDRIEDINENFDDVLGPDFLVGKRRRESLRFRTNVILGSVCCINHVLVYVRDLKKGTDASSTE